MKSESDYDGGTNCYCACALTECAINKCVSVCVLQPVTVPGGEPPPPPPKLIQIRIISSFEYQIVHRFL